VELGGGRLYAVGMEPGMAATLVLALIASAIAVIDSRHHVIPDRWNAILAATGLLFAALGSADGLLAAFIGMIFALAVGLVLRLAYAAIRGRQGLGLGDVKFLAASGAWVGAFGLPFLVLFASISGLVFAVGLHLGGRPVSAASRIAFGPHLAVGLFLTWVLKPAGLL
jgi:leader peptidase (prepilin peptidase) / N-methyltransferase